MTDAEAFDAFLQGEGTRIVPSQPRGSNDSINVSGSARSVGKKPGQNEHFNMHAYKQGSNPGENGLHDTGCLESTATSSASSDIGVPPDRVVGKNKCIIGTVVDKATEAASGFVPKVGGFSGIGALTDDEALSIYMRDGGTSSPSVLRNLGQNNITNHRSTHSVGQKPGQNEDFNNKMGCNSVGAGLQGHNLASRSEARL